MVTPNHALDSQGKHGISEGGIMRKFFESGLAFMLVALVWVGVGLLSARPGLGALGVFWLVLAIAVRARSTKKQRSTSASQRKDVT
jgi:hypothetical protein